MGQEVMGEEVIGQEVLGQEVMGPIRDAYPGPGNLPIYPRMATEHYNRFR
jgi:hypothetical protein